ncbi:uncharacterized protein A4U43_C09F12360 [Asparagus officinalis]|uniref:Uncharacterized protein n=1 Tax=Asparagus officinalis TaxID=4686 RepID=A0A5P1E788_ASPOF|nr:uncharacterized protein A4U43_C09F12360 [Asparagus officinalis]
MLRTTSISLILATETDIVQATSRAEQSGGSGPSDKSQKSIPAPKLVKEEVLAFLERAVKITARLKGSRLATIQDDRIEKKKRKKLTLKRWRKWLEVIEKFAREGGQLMLKRHRYPYKWGGRVTVSGRRRETRWPAEWPTSDGSADGAAGERRSRLGGRLAGGWASDGRLVAGGGKVGVVLAGVKGWLMVN